MNEKYSHDLKELARIHSLGRGEVSARLLERLHGSSDAMHGGDGRNEREDCGRMSF